MRNRFLKDVFFLAIEQNSKGRLKVEDHLDGELVLAYEALGRVVKSPTFDLATVVSEYTAKELPLPRGRRCPEGQDAGWPYGQRGQRLHA